MIKRIAVIGPESTGKSTLCQRLAEIYKTQWVPEYAREYLSKNGMPYSYDALLEIAKGQLASEDKCFDELTAMHTPFPTLHPLFIDTEMYVMKVWAEFVFGKCHQFIIDKIVERQYDLYLLCDIDLPWTPDVLREYPDPLPRQKLFCMYEDILINQSTPWVVIRGDVEERLKTAIKAVNETM